MQWFHLPPLFFIFPLPCHLSFIYLLFFKIFIWLCYILVAGCRNQGTKSSPRHWDCRVLATGPPGKSPFVRSLSHFHFPTFPFCPSTSMNQDLRDVDSIPGSERFPWRREWPPTPVFLPGESMDRGAWRATVHGVAKSQTPLK